MYPQNLLETPQNANTNEVWALYHNQSLFKQEYITRNRNLFPNNTKFEYWHAKAPAEIIPGYYDPEVMGISTSKYIIIVFRGTDRVGGETDSGFRIGEWTGSDFEFLPIRTADLKGRVHNGFYKSVSLVKERIADWIIDQDGRNKKIWITGHSLGGAHAQLFAAFLASKKSIKAQGVFTFASPHVGDKDFVRSFNRSVGKSKIQRFEFLNDPVPKTPPSVNNQDWGCSRAGIRNYFSNLNTLSFNTNETNDLPNPSEICYHHSGWYINACFNQLNNTEQRNLPRPFEAPNKNYSACNNLLVNNGTNNNAINTTLIEGITWSLERGKDYAEKAFDAGKSATDVARHLYEVGRLSLPEIIQILKASGVAVTSISAAIIIISTSSGSGIAAAIPPLLAAGIAAKDIAVAMYQLYDDKEKIIKHLEAAGVGLLELTEIAKEVLDMQVEDWISLINSEPVEDIKSALKTVWDYTFNPNYPIGLEPDKKYYLKSVYSKKYIYLTDGNDRNNKPGDQNKDNVILSSNSKMRFILKGNPAPIKDRFRIVAPSGKLVEAGNEPGILITPQGDGHEDVRVWDQGISFTASTNQHWEIKKLPNGKYTIYNVMFDKYFYCTRNHNVAIGNPRTKTKIQWEFIKR